MAGRGKKENNNHNHAGREKWLRRKEERNAAKRQTFNRETREWERA